MLSLKDQALILSAGVSFIVAIISLILSSVAAVRTKKLRNRYRSLMKGESGIDIESLIHRYNDRVIALEQEIERMAGLIKNHDLRITQKVETAQVLRYNAFGEKGNDLSFSVAFLDEKGTGAVISSIFGRDESRVYAKPIVEKKSNYALTNEEQEVILKQIK
ncbi:hypothetical protein BM613_11735 [Sulfoacidibacillus thermotolerans]|uniref:DUF4446 domain-containing protein n=2 Tax=Sulfoacidibacillus thermotolerans TaxID=1765684 RepID=A0A2U3D6D7_SULT2|nr:hypothetical protein BM613_11735 [Sulfoacidibacillus thermotolerans]